MKKVLIVYAHPMEEKSRANTQLIHSVSNIEHVTVNKLYDNYPDYYINVKKEQEMLMDHDVIIWHHPFYWYSAPSLLKEWFDLVLEHGFAYGKDGNALKGKKALNCITTGGRASTYEPNGLNRYRVEDFLIPYNQSAHLCGMEYLEPFVIHGVHLLSIDELKAKSEAYVAMVKQLRDSD